VRKTASMFTAIACLAIRPASAADSSPGAQSSSAPSPPGIVVTDQSSLPRDASDTSITFSKTLRIVLTVNSTVNAGKCTVPDPSYQWAKLQLIGPTGAKSDLGSIGNSDIYGSADCSGHHSSTKSFDVAGAKGDYIVILVVETLVNRRPKSGPYFVYPSIRIEADGQAALDRSFPSYGDQARITQAFPLVFK